MEVLEIQQNKLDLINWISQLQDISLIEKLKNIRKEEALSPQWQQDIVLERIRTAKPEDYIPWEEAKKSFRV